MYRTHSFHTTESGCALVLQKDIMYWGVDELTMEPCCALKYYPEAEWALVFCVWKPPSFHKDKAKA